MEKGDIIKMSRKELKRLKVIHQVLEENLKQVRAAEILHLTDRQIRRIVKRIRGEGDEGIIHKNRGVPSNSVGAQINSPFSAHINTPS